MIPLTIEKIEISSLKENEKISALVPEMTEIEYDEFIQSIREEGIRTPIHIQEDMTILDGRHRVRACREMGITHIQAIVHNLSSGDAVKFATTTAVNRRNLTPAQRIDIALRCTELLDEIKRKAKENQAEFKANQFTGKVESVSTESDSKNTNRVSKQIADISKTSRATVNRLLRIKREDEQKYDEVVKGEKSIRGAHDELPSVKAKAKKPKESTPATPIVEEPEETEEETEIFVATENLRFNANQIIGLVESYEELLEESIIEFEKVEPQKVSELEISVTKILEAIQKAKGRAKHEENQSII